MRFPTFAVELHVPCPRKDGNCPRKDAQTECCLVCNDVNVTKWDDPPFKISQGIGLALGVVLMIFKKFTTLASIIIIMLVFLTAGLH